MSNRISLNIVARADTKQARTAIRALSNEVRAANASNAQALNVLAGSGLSTIPIARIGNQLDDLTNKINKGKLTMSEFGQVWRNKSRIIRHQSALMSAELIKTNNAMRGISSGVLHTNDFSNAQVRMIDKVRLTGSALRGLSTHVVDFGKNMQWAGRQITVGFTVPFIIAGSLAARQFLKLEDQIVRFEKVFNEGLGTSLQEASSKVQKLAENLTTEMGRAAEDTLEVAAAFAQMGKNIEQVEELTRETMRLSTLGEVPTETSTSLLRGIQAVYKVTNEELVGTVDLLNAIENNTALTVKAMAESVPQLLPIFDQFNLSLGEGVGVLAGMNETLGNANEAANAFKAIAQRMFDPTQEAIDKFASLGINLQAIVSDNEDDLLGFFKDLGIVLEQEQMTAEEFARTFGNLLGVRQAGRGLTAIKSVSEALRGVENDASRAFDRIGNGAQNAADSQTELNRQLNSLGGQLRVQVEAMKVNIAEIGKMFLEMALPVVKFVARIVESFANLDDGTKRAILTVMTFASAIGGLMIIGIAANMLGNLVKGIANLLPGARMMTGELKASELAMNSQNTSATNLLKTLLGLDVATDNLAASQNAMAAATRNASSALAGQQSAVGSTAATSVVGGVVPMRTPSGKWKDSKTGRFISPKHPSVVAATTHPMLNPKTGKPFTVTNEGRKSPKASHTRLQGQRGKAGAILMAGGMAGSLVAESPGASAAANVALMVGALGMADPLLSKMKVGFAGIGKAAGKATTTIGRMVGTITGGRAGAGIMARGALLAAGSGAFAAGSVVAAVAAVTVGLGLWRARVSEANNVLLRTAKLSGEVAKAADIELGRVKFSLEDEVTNETSQAQKVINEFHKQINDLSDDAGGLFSQQEMFKKVLFDITTRGDITDMDTIREIIERAEIDLGININVNTDSMQDLVESLVEDQMNMVNFVLDRARRESGTPGGLGMGDRFQLQKTNDNFVSVAQVMAESLAGASAVSPEAFGKMLPEIQAILDEFDDANLENLFTDKLVELLPEMESFGDELSSLNEVIGFLVSRRADIAAELPDVDFLGVQQATDQLERRILELAGAQGGPDTGLSLAPGFDENAVNDVLQQFRDRVHHLTVREGKELDIAISDATQEMLANADQLPGNVGDFIEQLRNLLNAAEGVIRAEITQQERRAGRASAMTPAEKSARMHMDAIADRESLDEFERKGLEDSDFTSKASEIRSHLSKAFNDLLSDILEHIEEEHAARIGAIDAEIERLKEVADLEDERDKKLEERFKNELDRMRQLQDELQDNIDFDAAIARGNLDEAGAINQARMFGSMEDGLEEFQRRMSERSTIREEQLDKEVTDLEGQKDELNKIHDANIERIEEEFDLLKRTTPRTVAEWKNRARQVERIVASHNVNISADLENMAVDAYEQGMDNYSVAVAEDNRWEAIGTKMAEDARAAMQEVTGAIEDELGNAADAISDQLFGRDFDFENKSNPFAGTIPRVGIPPTMRESERTGFKVGGDVPGLGAVPAILHGGEYVLTRSAVQRYGIEALEAMNAGKYRLGGLVTTSGTDSSGSGGSMGGMFGMFSKFIELLTARLSNALSGLFGENSLLGGLFSGGDKEPGNDRTDYTGGSGKLSIGEIYRLALGRNLSSSEARTATAIALGESSGNPRAFNPVGRDLSYGLWQINMLGSMGPARRSALGLSANEELFNPATNAAAMDMISGGGSNWQPWTVYSSGAYKKYLDDVDRGIIGMAGGGRLRVNNVLANLHKGEAVLRAPIAKSLEQGIRNIESGGGNSVTVTLEIGEFHGTEENMQRLTKMVKKEIERAQDGLGRRKVFG